MIVRDRPSGLRLFLIMRGSVLPTIRNSLAVTTLLAVFVTWTGGQLGPFKLTITSIPFTLMALPLAIFLGFRNNAAYDRYWEARKRWVDAIGYMTPLVVAIVAYTFFGLDALGDEIEEPFGTSANDLPLDALCRAIEIDLREALGDKDTPPPLTPQDFCLT